MILYTILFGILRLGMLENANSRTEQRYNSQMSIISIISWFLLLDSIEITQKICRGGTQTTSISTLGRELVSGRVVRVPSLDDHYRCGPFAPFFVSLKLFSHFFQESTIEIYIFTDGKNSRNALFKSGNVSRL